MSPDDSAVAIESTLTKAGFNDPDGKLDALSGGWKKRLTISAALLSTPDLVFLDEPTNHLDVDGVFWLENLLNNARFTWVLISHDRFFLDRTVKKIGEVGRVYPGGIFIQECRYSDFHKHKTEYFEGLARQEESLSNKVRREVEWLRRGPQARTTKARSRIDEAHKLMSDLKDVRKKLQKSESQIEFAASGRKTKRLLVAKEISKGYGDKPLFKDLDLVLAPKMVLGILGPNGSGKSTLLKVLQKIEPVDSGSIEQAPQLKIVYFDQNRAGLDPSQKLKDALSEVGGDSVIYRGKPVHIVTWAKKFQFDNEQLTKNVSQLSGGEKARVLISKLMQQDADILILDEPTNDLDIDTLEILEESLMDFPGCIVLVSHDRFLMSRLADMCVGFLPGGKALLYADYEQWENEYRGGGKKNKEKKISAAKEKPRKARTLKLSYMEQREYDGMEEKILEAETALEEAQKVTESPEIAQDTQKLQEAYIELQKSQENVEKLYERWSELEAKVKEIEASKE